MAKRRSSSGVSSSFVCDTGGDDEEKIITVGIRRAISAASCRGPLGIAVSLPPESATAWRPSAIRRSSKGIGGVGQRGGGSAPPPSGGGPPPQPPLASGRVG